MHHFLPTDLTATLDDLSVPRLSSYRSFFTPSNDQELYGIYCWNDAISIRFLRLIGILEIIMRNRFHRELSNFAHRATSIGTADSNNWYKYIVTPGTKTAQKITKDFGTLATTVPAHQVVAKMTFGFWHNLLRIDHTPAAVPLLWKARLPSIFSDHPQRGLGYWKKEHNRDKVFARIAFVNDFRNRIAHFEPLWKFGHLMDEWLSRASHPVNIAQHAPTDVAGALARLWLAHERTVQLLSWLSVTRAADYRRSENCVALEWLFTQDGFDHYRNLGTVKPVRLSSFSRSWGAKLVLRNGKATVLTSKSQIVGMYIPVLRTY